MQRGKGRQIFKSLLLVFYDIDGKVLYLPDKGDVEGVDDLMLRV